MNQEIKAMKLRHAARQNVIKSYVDIAPAMGMVGTLIGLVFMLAIWPTRNPSARPWRLPC